jgi:HEAT repeat protein
VPGALSFRAMKNLSPRARALLEALHGGARGGQREALVLELAERHEPALVLPVLELLGSARDGESRALAIALHQLVTHLGPEDVRAVDEALRQHPARLDDVAALSPSGVALLTSHPNGHLRQAALERLSASGNVTAWPFFLLRLNDWVGPVREAARRAVTAALPRVPLQLLARHFALVEALGRFTRADHGPVVDAVMERLRQPDALAWLEAHLDALDRPARRAAFRLLIQGPEETARRITERGLNEGDAVVQRLALERVEALFVGNALPPLLARMERSRNMTVRREAYGLYARRVPGLGETKVREALMDRHRAVRDFAQRRLAGTGEVAALYRAALEEEPVRPGAIAGLGEVGRVTDAPRLRPFASDSRLAVRREAVTALGRLAEEEVDAALLRERFLDAEPGVRKAAALALMRRSGRFTSEWLRGCIVASGREPNPLRQALQLTPRLSRFDALGLLLDAAELSDERSRAWARVFLEQWLREAGRGFAANPSRVQIQTLREAVRTARHLDAGMALELDHQLRAFEP